MSGKLSIVIPTYNEGSNVVPLIDKIYQTMNGHTPHRDDLEVVVIDDNSPDGTGHICQSLLNKYPSLKIVVRTGTKGLGSAVKRGIMESSGDTIVVMDADFSHDCATIPRLVAILNSDSTDIAIASRYTEGSTTVSALHLKAGSRALNLFVRTILRVPVRDMTGGFFAAKRESLQALDSETVFSGYGDYSIALLYKSFKKGLRLREIPFAYSPRQDGFSKTSFFRAGFSYGIRALKLRLGLE